MGTWDDDFGSAGDLFSGSQNPDEQNDWLTKQQQALNRPASGAAGFTAAPTGLTPANKPETTIPKIEPIKTDRPKTPVPDFTRHWDDPLDKLPSGHVNFHLENKYSGRAGPWDWAGRPFPRHEAEPMIANRKKDLRDMSQDMRDILFLTNYQNDATFRERTNRAIHELSRIMPELKAGKAVSESASEPAAGLSGQATNLPVSQKRSGLSDVPSPKPVVSSGTAATGAAASRVSAADPASGLRRSAVPIAKPATSSEGTAMGSASAASGQLSASPVKPAASSGTTATGATAAPEQTDHSLANRLQTTAHVNDPHNQTYAPLLQGIADFFGNALGEKSAIHGQPHSQHIVGPSDESMGEAYRAAGEAVRQAARKNFVEPSAVNAQGTYPPGHLDESMAELEKAGFGKMQHQAIADTIGRSAEAEGTVMNREHGSEFARHFGKGIAYSPEEAETHALALAALIGDIVDPLIPGDPTGLDKTKADLIAHKEAEEAQHFTTLGNVFERGWESLAEKGSDWIAEQAGRKLVFVPAAIAFSLVPSLCAITGMAMADVAADLYGETLYRTGKGEPLEAVTYAIPLGLLQRLVPSSAAMPAVRTLKDLAPRLGRMILQGIVNAAQDEQVENVANRKKKKGPQEQKNRTK